MVDPGVSVKKKHLFKVWRFLKNELGYGYRCSKCHRQAIMNYFCGGEYPIIGFFYNHCNQGWSIEFFKPDKHKKILQQIGMK